MFQATLFDYNGVLVDDEHVHFEAFREVLAGRGIRLTEAEYWDEYLGFDDVGAFRAALSKAGQPYSDSEIQALVEQKKPVYLRLARGTLRGFPGAAELVRARAAAGPVVIVSGALRSEIELGLETLGVSDVVRGIVAAEDTRASKPDPEGYQLGLQLLTQLGVSEPARNAIVFEDSLDGISAACDAGITCVAIAHSYPAARLAQTRAQWVVEKIADIDGAGLDALWQKQIASTGKR